MIPQAAMRETRGIHKDAPSMISNAPLMSTNSFGNGKYGGMIFKKNSGRTKCISPAKIRNTASTIFETSLVLFIGVFVGC
jgi:hypothetical protein